MKAPTVVLLSAVAGSLLGAAITWANFGRTPEFHLNPSRPESDLPGPKIPQVAIQHTTHDFGSVARDIKVSHAFRFTNTGTANLTLKPGSTTCSRCTIARIADRDVAPGQTVDVVVEYLPSREQPHFRQTAVILTNDPHRESVDLDIFGQVVSDYEINPRVAQFSKVSITEEKTVELALTAGIADSVKIVKYDLENPDTAPYFEIAIDPLPPEKLIESEGQEGYRVGVTLKPGLPLGPIRQRIRIELSVAGKEKNPLLEVPVQGTVDSDISLAGLGWEEDIHLLKWGEVNGAVRTTRELSILVRGAHRKQVEITTRSVEGPLLVKLGEPEDWSAAVRRFPLTLEIPPGTPPCNYSGTALGKFAKILLTTTHPDVKEFPVYVQVIVEK